VKFDGESREITEVWGDGPAARAGIETGDVFLTVNGTDVSSRSPVGPRDLVLNPPGTRLEITSRRPSRDALVRVSLLTECIPASFGTFE
jgi:C-terminal processing protease CtpA/Prc